LAAFNLAWRQGADGVEGDYYLTKDGEVVCIHDATTGRTGDRDLKVAESTLAELRSVDVGAKRGEAFRGERIPTLGEVLATVPAGKRIFIEIKCGPQILPAIGRALDQAKSSLPHRVESHQVTIISFDAAVIAAARKSLPELKAVWITDFSREQPSSEWRPRLDEGIETLRRIDAQGIDVDAKPKAWSPAELATLRAAGFELHCWTVDNADLARQWAAWGATSITTNRPGEMRKWLTEPAAD
jgi:glycerophosphoryl diester phosphodiesterase